MLAGAGRRRARRLPRVQPAALHARPRGAAGLDCRVPGAEPAAEIVWLSRRHRPRRHSARLRRQARWPRWPAAEHVTVVRTAAQAAARRLAGVENDAAASTVQVLRAEPAARAPARARPRPPRPAPRRGALRIRAGETRDARHASTCRVELRNQVARVEIAGERIGRRRAPARRPLRRRSASASSRARTASRRSRCWRRSITSTRALAAVRGDAPRPKGSNCEAIDAASSDNVSVMMLADIGALPHESRERARASG